MGCCQSTPERISSSEKKSKKSFDDVNGDQTLTSASLYNNIPQAHLDKLGLNYRQIFSLKQSWKGIKRKMEDTGVEMFVRLFKTNAELQEMFQGFKDIKTDDELRSNEALEYHATLVMTTLDDAMTHIDNYDFVKQLLHKTGASHIQFAGFLSTNFAAIKEPFLEAVRVTLGDRYTENMQNIYAIAITFILDCLMEGLNEALEQQKTEHQTIEAQQAGNHAV